jgi:hypothetical protein
MPALTSAGEQAAASFSRKHDTRARVRVQLDGAKGAGIGHLYQCQRAVSRSGQRLASPVHQGKLAQVQVEVRVAVQRQKRPVDQRLGQLQRATRPQRAIFHRIAQPHAPAASVAQVAFDLLVQIAHAKNDLADPAASEQLDLVLKKRFVANGRQRFGPVAHQRTQPHAQTTAKDQCPHGCVRGMKIW